MQHGQYPTVGSGCQSGISVCILGGFLGAGKTTAILRLAQMHAAARRRAGIIANDIGQGLVDTQTYRAHGLAVEEMSGTCFACRFEDLLAAAGRLEDGHQPDVLLAEPSGSCTDIVSRVIEPLRNLYADRFRVAPYVTLLDPHRALQALSGTGRQGLSAKVMFLYKMQQNEADIIAINKADTLAPEQREDLLQLARQSFPKAQVLMVSARTGEGFEELAAMLEGGVAAGANALPPDARQQDRSSQGDAQLAWLDETWELRSADPFDADAFLLELASDIQFILRLEGIEPAHVKMVLETASASAIASIVGNDRPAELSQPSHAQARGGKLIVNARVEAAPAVVQGRVESCILLCTARRRTQAWCLSARAAAPPLDGTCPVAEPGN